MRWFHNHEYRHLLRSYGDYKDWGGTKSIKKFEEAYAEIKKQFKKHQLKTHGFSDEHTIIIARVLDDIAILIINSYGSDPLKKMANQSCACLLTQFQKWQREAQPKAKKITKRSK